jgi:hypothetical protein
MHVYGDFGSTGELRLKPKHALISASSSKLSKKLHVNVDELKELKQQKEKTTLSDADVIKQDSFRYRFKSLDLGDIYKIVLNFNQPGKKTSSSSLVSSTAKSTLVKMSWFLRKVEIKYDKRKFLFVYNKLVNTDNMTKANRKYELKILEQVIRVFFNLLELSCQ